jgi:hypothetical protein
VVRWPRPHRLMLILVVTLSWPMTCLLLNFVVRHWFILGLALAALSAFVHTIAYAVARLDDDDRPKRRRKAAAIKLRLPRRMAWGMPAKRPAAV